MDPIAERRWTEHLGYLYSCDYYVDEEEAHVWRLDPRGPLLVATYPSRIFNWAAFPSDCVKHYHRASKG